MDKLHITKMAKAVKQKIDENPRISEKEIENVLTSYWAGKKAIIWSTEDIKSYAKQMYVPMNDQMAGQLLHDLAENAEDAEIGITWDSVESAIQKMYPKAFDGFKMVKDSGKHVVFGFSKQGVLQEKKMVELGSYDFHEDVLTAFQVLHLMAPGKFEYNWDGFEMFDPSDSFDVDETLREWQEWQENEAPGM